MLALALTTLTLVLTDVQSLPLDTGVLRAATETALRGSGVTLAWDGAAAGESVDLRGGDARVILMGRHPLQRGKERVLGAVRRGSESQAIWLYVEEVRAVLAAGGRQAAGAAATRELSVAVGRVLAHEVAHILAPGHPHSGEGLMARSVDRRTLTLMAGPLDAACLAAIRLALAPAPPAPATAASLRGLGASRAVETIGAVY